MGDGVMVVWGYPIARDDDALRAVRAAVAVRDGLAALPGDLHARLGINTGEAVVAFGAVDERADDAMGDAVNVAARLASAAAVDGVLIGESTARLAGDRLETEVPVSLQLKGKAEPVPAYGVVRVRAQRLDDGPPFVGRDRELEALLGSWRRAVRSGGWSASWSRASQGSARAASSASCGAAWPTRARTRGTSVAATRTAARRHGRSPSSCGPAPASSPRIHPTW